MLPATNPSAPSGLRDQIVAMPQASALLEGSLGRAPSLCFLRAMVAVGSEMMRLPAYASPASVGWLATAEQALRRAGVDALRVDAAVVQALLLSQRMRLASLRTPSAFVGFQRVLDSSEVADLVSGALRSLEHSEAPPSIPASRLSYTRDLRETSPGNLPHSRMIAPSVDPRSGWSPPTTEPSSWGSSPASSQAVAPTEGRSSESAVRLRVTEGTIPDEVASGVTLALAGLGAILGCVESNEGLRTLSIELNRDAGTHAVPGDVREMKAALLAGETSWRSFAYYEARYGERGRRFTRSDSAWLVTLAREQGAESLQQVHWLASVLAARGMPRLLLELHLDVLHAELSTSVPEQRTIYLPLKTMAESLRDARLQAVSATRTRELVATFVAAAPAGTLLTPAEGGTLLVAALADEKAGIARALKSLTDWLADPARFPAAWCAAVASTLEAAPLNA